MIVEKVCAIITDGNDIESAEITLLEPIVRCQDCAMHDAEYGECLRDPNNTGRGWRTLPDAFCSFGERA